MRRTKKIKAFRQPPKWNQKLSIQSISLACEKFFVSRGMPNREPFRGWSKSSGMQREANSSETRSE
jgi:hypothetical protein